MFDYELELLINYYSIDHIDFPCDNLDDLRSTIEQSTDQLELFKFLRLAVFCLREFVRLNFIGPPKLDQNLPFDLTESKSREDLALNGEPAYSLCRSPEYFRLAKYILI